MSNRAKGWNALNHRKQVAANRSRGNVEKVVDKDGTYICFMLEPAVRLSKGWTTPINDHKRERLAVKQALQNEERLTRAQRRRFMSRKKRSRNKS